MKRTAGTVLVGIFEMLFGLVLLLMAILLLWLSGNPSFRSDAGGALSMKFIALLSGIYGVCGALGIATAIGVFTARNWARIVTLVAGGFLVFIGAVTTFAMAVIPLPSPPNVSDAQMHSMRMAMSAFWMCIALIGVWWLVLFTRSRIVEMFKSESVGVVSERLRPLSITIIGGLFVFAGSIGFLFQFVMRTPTILLGVVVQGNAALFFNLFLTAVYLLLGIGLLRLDRRAYLGTLGLFTFGGINVVCLNLLPGRVERMQRYLQASPYYDPKQVAGMSWMFSPWYALLIPVVTLGIPLYFLVTRRAAFEPSKVEEPQTLVV
jgi:hypothetical protein